MRILVDGDACPSKHIIKEVASNKGVLVHIFIDSSHYFQDDYFAIHVIAKGKDAVDMAIVSFMEVGDVIITQDYGLAAMSLPKAKSIIHPVGFFYTKNNIDELLFKRHISAKARRSRKKCGKIKKRSSIDDEKFKQALIKAINQ